MCQPEDLISILVEMKNISVKKEKIEIEQNSNYYIYSETISMLFEEQSISVIKEKTETEEESNYYI